MLQRPGLRRVVRDAREIDLSGVYVQKEQRMKRLGPEDRPDRLGEEITGPEGFKMPLQERIPGVFAALRRRVEAMRFEDVFDCVAGEPPDMELL